jgi:hypothetical protein
MVPTTSLDNNRGPTFVVCDIGFQVKLGRIYLRLESFLLELLVAAHQTQGGSSCSGSASEKLEDPVVETSCKHKIANLACGGSFGQRGRRVVSISLQSSGQGSNRLVT